MADRATQLGSNLSIHTQLLAAADATQRAWSASRALTRAWDTLSTGADRYGRTTLVAAELGDLALRAGRLAYSSPQWTPACGEASPVRDPGNPAATAADLTAVVAALHHTADAESLAAAADYEAVHTAADDARLYVATRLLSEDYGIPLHYSPAPASRIHALLGNYDDVNAAFGELLKAASGLARACPAQSAVLSAAGLPSLRRPRCRTQAKRRMWACRASCGSTVQIVTGGIRQHRSHLRCPTRPSTASLSR